MRRKQLVSLSMLSVGVGLLLAATSVGAASSATSSALRGGTLEIDQSAATFDTLDPQLSYTWNDWQVLNSTQLLLVNYPSKAGAAGRRLFAEAAKSFPTYSKNGRVVTFHLRSGLRFDDGTPVIAADYERAWERILSPKMFAQFGIYDGLDTMVAGGQAFAGTGRLFKGRPTTRHISGITAKGLTLTFHLTKANPEFLTALALPWLGAVKPNMPYSNRISKISVYPSAGPYYIASNNLKGDTILKRNRFYHGARPANADKIVIHNLTDPNASLSKIESNKVDYDMSGVPLDSVRAVAQKYGYPANKHSQFHVSRETPCVDLVAFNTSLAPTNTINVRKALSYAIGRAALTKLLGPYSGTPTGQILQPGVPGYKKLTVYGNSPNVAKAEQVGGSALENGPPIDLYYNGLDQTRTQQAELMQSEFQAIGAKVTMDPETSGDYYGPLETPGTHWNVAAIGSACVDFPDPALYMNAILSDANITQFNNASFTQTASHAASLSGKARASAYAALDKRLMTKYLPVMPVDVPNFRYLTAKRVHNVVFSPFLGGPLLNAMSVR